MNPHRHLPPKLFRPGAGLARALSKAGFCSRSRAVELVLEGRVRVNGQVRLDPGCLVDVGNDRLEVDQQVVRDGTKIYLMVNKPRGLITTLSDDKGRRTVLDCLPNHLPFVTPVGRLDQASEGLLLFTNDTGWAAFITDPKNHVEKTYHVHADRVLASPCLAQMVAGIHQDGARLAAKRVAYLRRGTKTCWLEIVLDEGKNRHIRRLFEAMEIGVLQLVRVAVGPLKLGGLPKGSFRFLSEEEVRGVAPKAARK
ncbi:MAG TPA: pseudouridine synthase [Verrucomicrobiae bacterium]|nr:pseudouridine synthase [Verrucomicrobiae bacterium]